MNEHEVSGYVTYAVGLGGLSKVRVTSTAATAEIYLHGAHVTSFQKKGQPPLLFMSDKSWFAPDKAIRGGIPICFPWFGPREGDVAHGYARITEWDLVKAAGLPDGSATVHLRLPEIPSRPDWMGLRTEYIITVSDQLALELRVTNTSAREIAFENCLHSYFMVGDIAHTSVSGLKGVHLIDKVDGFAHKVEAGEAIWIGSETDRVYLNTAGPVEIHDPKLHRKIVVEKAGSTSTVVWNPWNAKARALSDFGGEEYKWMVCVESGNVGENKISLAPGKTVSLKVTLKSQAL